MKLILMIDGNRGNVFGDTAAAGRYLEIRMSKYGEDVFTHELSPDVVPYQITIQILVQNL